MKMTVYPRRPLPAFPWRQPAGFSWFFPLAVLSGALALSVHCDGEEAQKSSPEKKEKRLYKLTPPPLGNFSPPRLTLRDAVYDWGQAYRGEQIKHTFIIENQGGSPLVIENVKPQCGCTVAEGYEKVLAPGKSTSVNLLLETGAQRGAVKKYTEVITNGLAEDNKLWMQGEVEELLKLDPPAPRVEAILGTSTPSSPATVRIESNLEEAIKIDSVTPRNKLVKATLKPLPAGKGYEVSLEPQLSGKDRTAFQNETLEFKVEAKGKTIDLHYPIVVAVRDRIVVNPANSAYFPQKETATLAAVSPAGEKPAPLYKDLEIQSLGGPEHRFKVTEVAAKEAFFRTELTTVEEGKHYRLKVLLDGLPPAEKRFQRGDIEVKTDDPEVPVLRITVMAQFPQAGVPTKG